MNKKVSVIVPVYNGEQFIERCINSIISQTYADIEIIIIDDGSMDATNKICDALIKRDERIHLFYQENAGVVAARKYGVAQAKGQLLLFVDADDWLEPCMIDELTKKMGNADMISSGVYWEKYVNWTMRFHDQYNEGFYESMVNKQSIIDKMIYDFETSILQPLSPWMFNKMMRTELVKKVYEHMTEDIFFGEDAVFVYSYALLAKSIVITHEPYYHYCYNEQSVSHGIHNNILSNINKVYLEMQRVFDEYGVEEILYRQLQAWITYLVKEALNDRMGFYESGVMPAFLLDARQLGDAQRFVLYGAGRMGEDFANQLKKLGCKVVLWVDGNYEYWKKMGKHIDNPKEIISCDYDKIIIAVSSDANKQEIKCKLLEMGIDNQNIISHPTIHF